MRSARAVCAARAISLGDRIGDRRVVAHHSASLAQCLFGVVAHLAIPYRGTVTAARATRPYIVIGHRAEHRQLRALPPRPLYGVAEGGAPVRRLFKDDEGARR